jgi:hypothetical protein
METTNTNANIHLATDGSARPAPGPDLAAVKARQ